MHTDNPVLATRKALRLTQTEMARRLGMNISTIVRYEKGHLSTPEVVKLAAERLLEQQRDGAAA
jgi:transcriptional regulator with XRE-family HTH domain